MQTRCKYDTTKCKHDEARHARVFGQCKPACKPEHMHMQARCKPDAARASTCSHMQVRDCNTNSHATHIICNSHTQQTHTLSHMQLSPATHTCNTTCISHTNMHSELISMACSRLTYRACTDYFSGLHVQLRCKAHAAISRQCKHACTGLASYLHRVCIVFAS